MPRNLILRYSKENDLILDQFLGSGTTLIEAKLLNRRAIGIDINDEALKISKNRIYSIKGDKDIKLIKASARNLDVIESEYRLNLYSSPYSNIIKYSKDLEDDLSLLNLDEFYESMKEVSKEAFRVLKRKYCAIMMGDIRKWSCYSIRI